MSKFGDKLKIVVPEDHEIWSYGAPDALLSSVVRATVDALTPYLGEPLPQSVDIQVISGDVDTPQIGVEIQGVDIPASVLQRLQEADPSEETLRDMLKEKLGADPENLAALVSLALAEEYGHEKARSMWDDCVAEARKTSRDPEAILLSLGALDGSAEEAVKHILPNYRGEMSALYPVFEVIRGMVGDEHADSMMIMLCMMWATFED